MIKIYNTLTKQKEVFTPLNPPAVNMYACGVTVYDDCHIGHARSLYIFDVVRRYLRYRGYDVRFVRNITDVDDKIINRANDLKAGWLDLVGKYIAAYQEDLKRMDIAAADAEPRATQNIPEMITYIQALIQSDFAYATDTGVYFSVRKFNGYGKLSGQSLDQMLEGVRKATSESKQDPLDFALWKAAKEGEPFWESPWGKGRPGWHIECSVMSQKYLKTETLDIHAGGRDLVFPHHENEIAQSEALTGKPFARYWMHHGLLTIEAQKMSKSLGNFITIRDVLGKYPADVLKILYLQAHYSSPVDFSWEKMDAAKEAYKSINILMGKMMREFGTNQVDRVVSGGSSNLSHREQFIAQMDDDFNTPKALAVLFDLVHGCNKLLESDKPDKQFIMRDAFDIMREMTAILGLTFLQNKNETISDVEIGSSIDRRAAFKKEKKYQEADAIRKELEQKGVILEDGKDGKTTWRRKI